VSSDERLAQRAANGDRRAFEAIYKRYHQDLYRFCLAMVGNPQDAQDALQNAMVKVLRRCRASSGRSG
jgi:RNA polymerase sigma-70 factor (ECF subfamily)